MIALSKIIPIGFLSLGIFLLMQVVLPIASFQLWWFGQKYSNESLVSPTSSGGGQVLGISIQTWDNFPAIVSNSTRQSQASYSEFHLSIPKLNIKKAIVYVDSNELSKGLVHLPGSALPGEKGNVFISGHSALSKLLTFQSVLFAKLQDLKIGDQIIVGAGNAKYVYQVTGLKVVNPSDLSVISTPDSMNRYISLMTCVPPGLNLKRLVVLGKMI